MGKFMVMHEKLYFLKSIKTMSFIYFFPISEQTDWKYVCFCKVTSFSTSGWCWTKFFEEKKTFYVFFKFKQSFALSFWVLFFTI